MYKNITIWIEKTVLLYQKNMLQERFLDLKFANFFRKRKFSLSRKFPNFYSHRKNFTHIKFPGFFLTCWKMTQFDGSENFRKDFSRKSEFSQKFFVQSPQ